VNVWFLQGRGRQAEVRGKKLTEHEVAAVAAYGTILRSNQSPLTFPHRRSITLPRNLSVTANFLRHRLIKSNQNDHKKSPFRSFF